MTPTVTPPCMPVITNIVWDDSSSPKGDVTIAWEGEVGAEYDVYYADTFAGTYVDIADVTATGSSATWTDNGSETGSHPSTAGERYYKVGCHGRSSYAEYIVGMYKLTMGYRASTRAYSACSLPLVPYYTDDTPDINEVIGDQGHAHSLRAFADKIWRFDPVAQSFNSYSWNHDGVWEGYPVGASTTLDPDVGYAFLYQNSETDKEQDIFVGGRVAKGDECRNTITGKGSSVWKYSFVGYVYPGAEPVENAHLTEDGFAGNAIRVLGDKVWLFDCGAQSFSGYAWYDTASWRYSGAPAFEFESGEAYLFYNRNAVSDWIWTVPNPVGY